MTQRAERLGQMWPRSLCSSNAECDTFTDSHSYERAGSNSNRYAYCNRNTDCYAYANPHCDYDAGRYTYTDTNCHGDTEPDASIERINLQWWDTLC